MIIYKCYPARLGVYFDRCADKIHQVHKSGGKTLVHCVAGVSRSASLCMAYLMKYQRMTLDQAYYHTKKRRPVIHPNQGFWKQLIEYERRLFGRNTVKMIPSGIGPIPDVYKKETENMVWLQPRSSSNYLSPRNQSYANQYNTTYSRSYNTLPYRHGYWNLTRLSLFALDVQAWLLNSHSLFSDRPRCCLLLSLSHFISLIECLHRSCFMVFILFR